MSLNVLCPKLKGSFCVQFRPFYIFWRSSIRKINLLSNDFHSYEFDKDSPPTLALKHWCSIKSAKNLIRFYRISLDLVADLSWDCQICWPRSYFFQIEIVGFRIIIQIPEWSVTFQKDPPPLFLTWQQCQFMIIITVIITVIAKKSSPSTSSYHHCQQNHRKIHLHQRPSLTWNLAGNVVDQGRERGDHGTGNIWIIMMTIIMLVMPW